MKGQINNDKESRAAAHPVFGRLWQEAYKLQASLAYIAGPCLLKINKSILKIAIPNLIQKPLHKTIKRDSR